MKPTDFNIRYLEMCKQRFPVLNAEQITKTGQKLVSDSTDALNAMLHVIYDNGEIVDTDSLMHNFFKREYEDHISYFFDNGLWFASRKNVTTFGTSKELAKQELEKLEKKISDILTGQG